MAQEVLEGPWVAWEAMEETEEAFPNEDPGAPEGTPLEEEMSSSKPEIGSVQIRAVETRTSPGEQNVTSVRPPKSEASSRYPFHLQLVIMAPRRPW